MTYNFDPEKWHDDQVSLLGAQLAGNKISRAEYDAAVLDLEQRLEEMWARLDGTYQMPEKGENQCG